MIYLVVFPIVMLLQLRRASGKTILLEKQDTDVIRGVATCFVMLGHLIIPMKDRMEGLNLIWKGFVELGAVGVVLFFFVSGYGIYKSYADQKASATFVYRRFINVCLPCVLMHFVFGIIEMIQEGKLDVVKVLCNSILGDWFIDVLLIQYLIFYISWTLCKGKQVRLIVSSFLLSGVEAVLFYLYDFDARWYNALWLFPIGMLIAWKEDKIITSMYQKWKEHICFYFLIVIILGGIRSRLYWTGGSDGTNVIKILAGTSLCLLMCTFLLRIKLCDGLIKYMGGVSLFFYITHVELIALFSKVEGLSDIGKFYIILALTFFLVKVFSSLHKCFISGIQKCESYIMRIYNN